MLADLMDEDGALAKLEELDMLGLLCLLDIDSKRDQADQPDLVNLDAQKFPGARQSPPVLAGYSPLPRRPPGQLSIFSSSSLF
jgi:hypothetical protein